MAELKTIVRAAESRVEKWLGADLLNRIKEEMTDDIDWDYTLPKAVRK
jgi:hypothetical protein